MREYRRNEKAPLGKSSQCDWRIWQPLHRGCRRRAGTMAVSSAGPNAKNVAMDSDAQHINAFADFLPPFGELARMTSRTGYRENPNQGTKVNSGFRQCPLPSGSR